MRLVCAICCAICCGIGCAICCAICGGSDPGARHLRPEGILDPYRKAGVGRGISGFRMHHLGAVVSQLNGFGEADLRQRGCVRADAGVGREHPVHVRPDPYFIRSGRRSQDRGGIIRSSAPQRGGLALRVRAAVAGHDRGGSALQQREQRPPAAGARGFHVRDGVAEVAVGDDHLFPGHELGRGAALL